MSYAGSIIGGVGKIAGGAMSYKLAKKRAKLIRGQSEITVSEALRDAAIIREEGDKFAATQSLQYLGAGVELGGSALITLAQTKKYAKTEAEATERAGRNKAELMLAEARITEREGRAALISGMMGGASSFSSMGSKS